MDGSTVLVAVALSAVVAASESESAIVMPDAVVDDVSDTASDTISDSVVEGVVDEYSELSDGKCSGGSSPIGSSMNR